LLKAFQEVQLGGSLQGNVKYLEQYKTLCQEKCPAKCPDDFLNPELQLKAYQHRSVYLITNTAAYINEYISQGKSTSDMISSMQVESYRISNAHCFYILVLNFINTIKEVDDKAPELVEILTKLSNLFSLYYMEQDVGEFMEGGFLSGSQAQLLRKKVRELLADIRKQAVLIVDALNLSDYTLRSALGRYDGDYINALWNCAQMEPNVKDPVDGFNEYLKPLIEAGRERALKSKL